MSNPELQKNGALICFSLGPVQSFIASARTLRDLWSGSFILAWLTAHAARAVKQADPNAVFVRPTLDDSDMMKMIRALEKRERCPKDNKEEDKWNIFKALANDNETQSNNPADITQVTGNPNNFTALIDASKIKAVRKVCVQAVKYEWKNICKEVRKHLADSWEDSDLPDKLGGVEKTNLLPWDWGWKQHLQDYWEIYVAIQPPLDDVALLRAAQENGAIDKEGKIDSDANRFSVRVDLVNRMLGQLKAIRHSPNLWMDTAEPSEPYEPYDPETDHRPKCIQSGEHPQMTPFPKNKKDWPAINKIATEFWEKMAPEAHDRWERLQKKDRYGAPALVKRFAWSRYFSKKFGIEPEDKRMWDLATYAAMAWLDEHKKLIKQVEPLHEIIEKDLMKNNESNGHMDPKCNGAPTDGAEQMQNNKPNGHWNGQWLHWSEQKNANEEDAPPLEQRPQILEKIRVAKALMQEHGKGAPPIYYAILMCDGDKMGDHQRNAGLQRLQEISQAIFKFAERVPGIIKTYLGALIYAGGEDVLAILPCATVFAAAQELNEAYREEMKKIRLQDEKPFTLSAGITVAHIKHDLRDALEEARKTERFAKNAGRDRLALGTMFGQGATERHALLWGENSQNIAGLQALVKAFADGKSDGWLHTTLREWPKMSIVEQAAANHRYWLEHSEGAPKEQAGGFLEIMRPRDKDTAQQLPHTLESFHMALNLMLDASKMTRAHI